MSQKTESPAGIASHASAPVTDSPHITVLNRSYKVHSELKELSPEELVDTAKHEAGHCVIAKLCGGWVTGANLFSPSNEEWRNKTGSMHIEGVYDDFKNVMIGTAGIAGSLIDEEKPRPFIRSADNHDIVEDARGDIRNITKVIFEKPIYQGSVQVHPDFDYVAWVNEAFYLSHQLLRQNRTVFDELVDTLLEKKHLNQSELMLILNKLPRKSPRSKLYTWRKTREAIKALEQSNPNDPRLSVYKAAKRAQEIDVSWKARQAMEEAKKVYDAAKKASDNAQHEIQYMLRNGKTLIEAKKYFLGTTKQQLEALQKSLRAHRQLPWNQRNYQWMSAARDVIKVTKQDVAALSAELKMIGKAAA